MDLKMFYDLRPRSIMIRARTKSRTPMEVTKPYRIIWFEAMDVTKPYKFIGFGAMDVTKPYKSIGFGAMDVTKPCNIYRA